MEFSVLMSVYDRESPSHLALSLESLAAQTMPANEIVLVKDGPLTGELEQTIRSFERALPVVTVDLPAHRGLGAALRAGVEHCRFDWFARMDSDDVCLPHRFERQIDFLKEHPEVDVLGTSISEFENDHTRRQALRILPQEHRAVLAFAKFRNPLNHMTVMCRKRAVIAAGNYQERTGFEDYDLWVRMLLGGSRFHNLPEALVLARCGSGMQQRRGSARYARREIALFWCFRKWGFLTRFEFLRSVMLRAPLRVLPAELRSRIYRSFLRRPVSALKTGERAN